MSWPHREIDHEVKEVRMVWRLGAVGLLLLLLQPTWAAAADGESLDLPIWTGIPFVLTLLAIALLPLLTGHFWHSNRNKAIVAAILALPVAIYLINVGPNVGLPDTGSFLDPLVQGAPSVVKEVLSRAGTHALLHELAEYISFIVLLASLYTVSGGIGLHGYLPALPLTNAAFLACGAVLANLIGTTGASMLLIRPVLQINKERRHTHHLPVFFIFLVSNIGGVLTPLGDPPLFLGFLNGVDFFWTLSLWPQWLVANGVVLTLFYLWDKIAYSREAPEALTRKNGQIDPLRVRGLVNLLFLAGILVAVLFQSEKIADQGTALLNRFFPCPSLLLSRGAGAWVMLAMGVLSWILTPREVRQTNGFSWGAITEVAVLFAGIFVTMVPALVWLSGHGPRLGITEPWQYFWLSGGLSSFLDNAPTYLTFATMAAGPNDIGSLMHSRPLVLKAISCGAVFMGANTYIGNGPNFMVKAIAEEAGFKMPSFFGYMVYSGLILLPVFAVMTFLFFW